MVVTSYQKLFLSTVRKERGSCLIIKKKLLYSEILVYIVILEEIQKTYGDLSSCFDLTISERKSVKI